MNGAPLAKSTRPVVFLGPTLTRVEASRLLDADYRPPARKGDVYRCLGAGFSTIVIIDGVFHSEPSVWPREILEALDSGIEVFGASSMGALRAVELERYGMVGFGTVFEWFRDEVLDGDDEVALLFGPAESDYRPLSEPLVNIRATLDSAVKASIISTAQSATLVNHAKRQFYPERSYRGLLGCPEVASWPSAKRQGLAEFLNHRAVDVKRQDAIGLLRHLASRPVRDPLRPRDFERRAHPAQVHYRRFATLEGNKTGGELLESIHARPTHYKQLTSVLNRRWFLLSWAEEHGHRCPPNARARFRQRFEKQHGIDDGGAWLAEKGLIESEYRRWLDECAWAEWLRECGPAYFGFADEADRDAPFIADWGRAFGVTSPNGAALADWLIEKGPHQFGFADEWMQRLLREVLVNTDIQTLIRAEACA